MKKLFWVLLAGIFLFTGSSAKQKNYYVVRAQNEIMNIEMTLTKANAKATVLKRTYKNVTVQKVSSLQGLK